MTIDPETLTAMIEAELATCDDARIVAAARRLLVAPYVRMIKWDHGAPGQEYPCWIVSDDAGSAIAYCAEGFGPSSPWGLVWATPPARRHDSMGQDSAWFPTFVEAWMDSGEAADLKIWRLFEVDADGGYWPLTPEYSSRHAFAERDRRLAERPAARIEVLAERQMSGWPSRFRVGPADDRIVERYLATDLDWFRLIKELRVAYGLSIYEAEKLALSYPVVRHWCASRIASDPRCRKRADRHWRRHGNASLIVREGDTLRPSCQGGA